MATTGPIASTPGGWASLRNVALNAARSPIATAPTASVPITSPVASPAPTNQSGEQWWTTPTGTVVRSINGWVGPLIPVPPGSTPFTPDTATPQAGASQPAAATDPFASLASVIAGAFGAGAAAPQGTSPPVLAQVPVSTSGGLSGGSGALIVLLLLGGVGYWWWYRKHHKGGA